MTDTSADTLVPVAPLAPSQHRAALWADADARVFAVIMGERVPGLPARLAAADVADFDCLVPGALASATAREAPYLVQLDAVSGFTDWLLTEAAVAFPGWGVLVRSPARLLALRNHLRGLRQAVLPGGQAITLDWMDPAILHALLPGFGAAELGAFFGPVTAFTVPEATRWRHAEAPSGRLARRDVPVLAAKA